MCSTQIESCIGKKFLKCWSAAALSPRCWTAACGNSRQVEAVASWHGLMFQCSCPTPTCGTEMLNPWNIQCPCKILPLTLLSLQLASIALIPALVILELLRWTFSYCWLLGGLAVPAFSGAILGSQSSQKTICSELEMPSYQGRVLEVR